MVARDVPIGQVINADDLASVQISADPRIATVPAERLASTVGRVAAADLAAGTLLAETQTTDAMTRGPASSWCRSRSSRVSFRPGACVPATASWSPPN